MRAVTALLALPLVRASGTLSGNSAVDVDVVIVGAGWAGMAAADHLHRAGVSFVVLEAQNHTGGRSHAFQFGHPSVGQYIFEQGSNWVCGSGTVRKDKNSPTVRTNRVLDLAEMEGLQTAYIPGACDGNMSNYFMVYDEFGQDGDPTGKLRQAGNDALDCLNRTASDDAYYYLAHKTVRDGLNECGWHPKSNVEWAMDWALVDDTSGVSAEDTALSGFDPDPTYNWWGPDDWFVTDQHPRGFARLIDAMVRDTVPEGDARIVLNANVKNIDWSDHVTVSTHDGRKWTAKHAISTVSFGVLQKHHNTLFTPDLPSKHKSSLMNSGIFMANLTHVLIQFPTVWWDNSLPAWLSAQAGGHQSAGNFTPWHNMNHAERIPGSKTLLTFLGEPETSLYGDLSESELLGVMMDRLRRAHPDKNIPDGVAAWMKNWGSDPLFYGAYVDYAPGVSWSGKWKKSLKRHGKMVVQFAGEAACSSMDGYTHGALYSGVQAAANYLYQIGQGPDPSTDDALSLCDWSDSDAETVVV